tara:strand:- start:1174 stop:1743 length:570 start_codon:yes stop_codon:yes gene_type:complete
MSKKLLSEAQVRRFQSLASIKPLNEMYTEEEKPVEGMYKEEEEQPMEAMYEEEAPEPADEPADEPVEMDDVDGDEVDMTSDDLTDIADALDTLQAKLAPLLDAADSPEGDMGDDMGMGADAPDMGDDPIGGDEPADDDDDDALLEHALKGIKYQPSQKEVVREVAKRVARRLMEAKKAQANLNKALGKK